LIISSHSPRRSPSREIQFSQAICFRKTRATVGACVRRNASTLFTQQKLQHGAVRRSVPQLRAASDFAWTTLRINRATVSPCKSVYNFLKENWRVLTTPDYNFGPLHASVKLVGSLKVSRKQRLKGCHEHHPHWPWFWFPCPCILLWLPLGDTGPRECEVRSTLRL
jgi:hypothetical protein